MNFMEVAMRYLIYAFLGKRQNNAIQHGFKMCIYDSARKTNSHCPSVPALRDPIFSIDENAAGSLEFTLLYDSKTLIYYNDGTGSTETLLDQHEKKIYDFIRIKQTELVIYREILKENNQFESKEIWSGRISSIKKDFNDDWYILTDGELSYTNDIVLEGTEYESSTLNGETLISSIIPLYNQRIQTYGSGNISITIDNTNYLIPQLDRKIVLGTIEPPAIPMVVESSDLENKFTISDGATVWSVLQSLLDRYGGHFEITKNSNGQRILNWYKSGVYDEMTGQHSWEGYHLFNRLTSQVIKFGQNLLDFSEEQDAGDLFTVLIPHGQATTYTVTENGKEVAKTGPPLTITSVNRQHPNTPYIYDDALVAKYGWIEKIETWNLTNADTLYNIAYAYYKDLRIGSKHITIKAYDLKNLINNYSADRMNVSNLYALDALYLYDVIYVDSPLHAGRDLVGENAAMPIRGIKIPLDKFPTDTEYTISDKHVKKNALAPGSAVQKKSTDPPQPDPGNGTDPDVDPTTPTTTVEHIPAISTKYGIDSDMVHYPPIYLDRKVQYLQGHRVVQNNATEDFQVYLTGSWTLRDKDPNTHKWKTATRSGEVIIQESYKVWKRRNTGRIDGTALVRAYGYKKDDLTFVSGESNTKTVSSPGCVFYSDDITNVLAMMRIRNEKENKTNWFEKVFNDEPHEDNELAPFVSANSSYYTSVTEANILGNQPWAALYGGEHIECPDIEYGDPVQYMDNQWIGGDVINHINTAECLGSTVGDILTSIGASLSYDDLSQEYITMNMEYIPTALGNSYQIKQQLLRYKPTSFTNNPWYYQVGVLTIGESAVIYLAYYEKPYPSTDTPVPSDYEEEIRKKVAESPFVRFGVAPKSYFIDAGAVAEGTPGGAGFYSMYYRDETDSTTGLTYAIPTFVDGSLTTLGNLHQTYCEQDDGYGPSNGLPVSNQSSFVGALLPTSNVGDGLLGNLRDIMSNYLKDDASNVDESKKMQNNLISSTARTNVQPLFVLTKTTDTSTGSGYFGLISFTKSSGSSIEVTKTDNYYTLSNISLISNSNTSGTPVMICKDTLLDGTKYLFSEKTIIESGQTVTVLDITNGDPVPAIDNNMNQSSPTAIFVRCGGLQTKHKANNAFLRLAGDTYSSNALSSESATPVSPFKEGPGLRNERQKVIHENYNDIWYYGTDMKTKANMDDDFVTSGYTVPDKDKDYYVNTAGKQPVVLGSSAYIRITPNLFLKMPSASS